jgi:hypothetical protein
MPLAKNRRRKSTQQKVTSLKTLEGGAVMSEKQESNPFASLVTPDFYAEWRASLKQMVISSLDVNEKMARAFLARYEKAMTWTKDTPWDPWCKSLVTTAEKLIEDTSSLVRSAWHLEHVRDGPEKMAKV